MRLWERRYEQISRYVDVQGKPIDDYEDELAEFTDWLKCESLPVDWRFTKAMEAIRRLPKAPRAFDLLAALLKLGSEPEYLESALRLLSALLAKSSNELRWSIRAKGLNSLLMQGFASRSPTVQRLAEECRDQLLREGFFEFLEVGQSEAR